jgi:hypothetical protein
MSVTTEAERLMSDEVEVQRIDRTGTIWFVGTLLASAIGVAALILSGWRPSVLPEDAQIAWWIGAVMNAIGLAGVGYAGCPIYWGNVHVAHTQKSIAIRGGLVFYLLGSVMATFALLSA